MHVRDVVVKLIYSVEFSSSCILIIIIHQLKCFLPLCTVSQLLVEWCRTNMTSSSCYLLSLFFMTYKKADPTS